MKIQNVEDIKKAREDIERYEELRKEIKKIYGNIFLESLIKRGGIDKGGVFIQGIKDKLYVVEFK